MVRIESNANFLSRFFADKARITILVPRAHDPSGLWQGSRALAWSNTGSPRFTDFSSNLIGREHETNALRILRKSGPARALEPCHRPEGSWALGTRMTHYYLLRTWRSACACAVGVGEMFKAFLRASYWLFFAIFHMEAPENTQEFFSIAFL